MFNIKDNVILITGAAGHLGKPIADSLYIAGAKIIVIGRNLSSLQEKFSQLPSQQMLSVDIGKTEDIESLVEHIKLNFGRLDGIVNNAYSGVVGTIEKAERSDIEHSLNMNITAPLLLVKQLRALLKQSQNPSVVNIASMYGMVSPDPALYGDSGMNNPPFYGAGKAGLIQLTKYMACHLADDNIRVNAISPGPFPPAEIATSKPDFHESLVNKVPLKRVGDPEEISPCVQFLLSQASSYITGVNIPIDGGWTAW